MKSTLVRFAKTSVLKITRTLGVKQSEASLVAQSQDYWAKGESSRFRANSHWRGDDGISADTFATLGEQHLDMFAHFNLLTGHVWPLERVIEWGCGGGSNALAFARVCKNFVGVDVSQPTLDAFTKCMVDENIHHTTPALIRVDEPEKLPINMDGTCDMFLCTFVFELVPTPEYGKRLLTIARRLLKPGATAMIQIKYATADASTKPRRWGYRFNVANMTTYSIDDFWQTCESAGLKPLAIKLLPDAPLVGDGRYAYFFLQKV